MSLRINAGNGINAEHVEPIELGHEVSRGAIRFFADGLSGIYLPDRYKDQGPDDYSKGRLTGIFGRFSLDHFNDSPKDERIGEPDIKDILLMGSTIELPIWDHVASAKGTVKFGEKDFGPLLAGAMEDRDLLRQSDLIRPERADFGTTEIVLDEYGAPKELIISGASELLGRADTQGREQTVEMFQQTLGDSINVVNADPSPGAQDMLIQSR